VTAPRRDRRYHLHAVDALAVVRELLLLGWFVSPVKWFDTWDPHRLVSGQISRMGAWPIPGPVWAARGRHRGGEPSP
jgi:hypothetical protein